jgi:hypothetical protein
MTKRKFTADTVENTQRQILEGVGYGKPPAHTRFRKGISGNPAGRPRKDKSRSSMETEMSAAFLAQSRRMVTVQDKDGQISQIPALDAVVLAQLKSAMKGNAYAQENFLKRSERLEKEEAESIELQNAKAEHHIAWCRGEIEAARSEGRPEPEFLPHPDDIIFEPGKRYKVAGPVTEKDLADVRFRRAIRDIYLMQHVLEGDHSAGAASLTYFVAEVYNLTLPKRMQLDKDAIMMSPYRRMPSAKLRALIRTAWQELGCNGVRGTDFILPEVDRKLLLAVVKKTNPMISGSQCGD